VTDVPGEPTSAEATSADVLRAPEGSLVESIFDNLSFWTLVSAAIGLLYLIWATIEILSRYVGHLPNVSP
jgi:hypothetical protein